MKILLILFFACLFFGYLWYGVRKELKKEEEI